MVRRFEIQTSNLVFSLIFHHQQYGFTKVRRGPETDMYTHESFTRDHPELLLHLRKTTSACQQQRLAAPKNSKLSLLHLDSRAVSPSPSGSVASHETAPDQKITTYTETLQSQQIPQWAHVLHKVSPVEQENACVNYRPGHADWGKLDLLAFALAQASEAS